MNFVLSYSLLLLLFVSLEKKPHYIKCCIIIISSKQSKTKLEFILTQGLTKWLNLAHVNFKTYQAWVLFFL